jgi:hypothetical protein
MTGADLLKKFLDQFNRAEPWHKWFAWHPVTIDNQKFWLCVVYRRRQWSSALGRPDNSFWQYRATIFDLMKEDL